MANSKKSYAHSGILLRVVVCLLLLLSFAAVAIYPEVLAKKDHTRQIAQLKDEIARQRTLQPVYKALKSQLDKKDLQFLPQPELKALTFEQIGQVGKELQQAAETSSMTVTNIAPHPESLADGLGLLKVTCELRGDFMDLRNFLIELGNNPYLRHIEAMDITEDNGARKIVMEMWMALAATDKNARAGGAS